MRHFSTYLVALFAFLILFLAHPVPSFAWYNPGDTPNNQFGIHIVDPNDLSDAAHLVNSTGGDWGYVTLVIQEDDRDIGKWQRLFDSMRSLHLIPIVRIATHIEKDAWAKPYKNTEHDWAKFLNTLNWPIENRYVVVYNEPNHANEWGKTIDPEGYADTLVAHAKALKAASADFFILPAGLDVSAATDGKSMDAAVYLSRMLKAQPNLFDDIDGFASHSYPNPAFSGSPYAVGRGTLRSYLWELQYLRSLGVTKSLPVFITETGWVHSEGASFTGSYLSSFQVATNIAVAAQFIWRDPQIVAITPFVLNYQGLPFDHFSWRKLNTSDFYPQYQAYQQIPKTAGRPYQRERYTTQHPIIPTSLVSGSSYVLSGLLKNEGQGIYSEQDQNYRVSLQIDSSFVTVCDPLPVMEPNQFGTLTVHIETPTTPGDYPYTLQITHYDRKIVIEEGTLRVVPPPSITINAKLGWRSDHTAKDATILIYDNLTLIHKIQGVTLTDGKATVKGLHNVVPGNKYRIVLLVPYYLPRQQISALSRDSTDVSLPRLYPFDFDIDGTFTLKDIGKLLTLQPHFIISLFVGP